MSRLRFVVVAIFALVLGSCNLLQQQENFISFTWDGAQYFFTAGNDDSGRPYAVGYTSMGGEVTQYKILASATSQDAADGTNTIVIYLFQEGNYWWYGEAYVYDSYGDYDSISLSEIPAGMIDSFITNRDAVGEQFAGAMPGPFQGETPVLENIVFSVERLPNMAMEIN